MNTIEIRLPSLRERREDIPLLAEHFLLMHAQLYRKALSGFDEGARQALQIYHWPGNVRELDHAAERSVLMAQDSVVRAGDLGLKQVRDTPGRVEDMTLEEVESLLVQKALARFEGNVSRAAEGLGLSRSTLYRRLEKFKL